MRNKNTDNGIRENDYVRFIDGSINKVEKVKNNNVTFENYWNVPNLCNIETCDMVIHSSLVRYLADNISSDILEILKPMDLMLLDISPDDCGGIVVPRIAETQAELEEYKDKIRKGMYVLTGVVTRENIKNNIYKL